MEENRDTRGHDLTRAQTSKRSDPPHHCTIAGLEVSPIFLCTLLTSDAVALSLSRVEPHLRYGKLATSNVIIRSFHRLGVAGHEEEPETPASPAGVSGTQEPVRYKQQSPRSARRNNFPGEQISRRFLLLSEHRWCSKCGDAPLHASHKHLFY